MSKTKTKSMICKIQVSLFGNPATLIYNEDQSLMHECEREFGANLLGEDLKGYFKCSIDSEGLFNVDKRVKDQDW